MVERDELGRFVKGCHFNEEERKKFSQKGEHHPMWNGGRRLNADGYIEVYSPNHPFKSVRNTVKEHRLVMEERLGRYLTEDEIVHHINENITDNRIENLQVMTREEHNRLHNTKDMSKRVCFICGSNKTYINKNSSKRRVWWFRHPVTREEWICRQCYRKLTEYQPASVSGLSLPKSDR